MTYETTVGVVIGRFQVAALHEGHRHLLDEVHKRHKQVLVLLGVHGGQPTDRNPLDAPTRSELLWSKYPQVMIREIYDHESNEAWSSHVDGVIAEAVGEQSAVLYGSRDSFAPHYSGAYPVEIIDEIPSRSGTEIRDSLEFADSDLESFRKGLIYAHVYMRFPTAYTTVDVAVLHTTRPEVLLGRKRGEDRWRFLGGFVDPTDESLERAAKREVREEASDIEIDHIQYVGSRRVDDARYRGSTDSVTTTFFTALYIFGAPRAADDIEEVQWVQLDQLLDHLMPSHKELGEMLLKHLTRGDDHVTYNCDHIGGAGSRIACA